MAIDALYNIYNVVDPVAVCLNACVDAEYAKVVKPLQVTSVTDSLLSDYTAKAGGFFSNFMPSFGGSKMDETKLDSERKEDNPNVIGAVSAEQMTTRPKTKRQITSELDLAGLRRFERAEARMLALNPQGSIDYYLTAEGFSQYYDMLLSHASYWSDVRFATFVSGKTIVRLTSLTIKPILQVLTQLLASPDALQKSKQKREEAEEQIASEHAKKSAEETNHAKSAVAGDDH